jgi:hypothetical protein
MTAPDTMAATLPDSCGKIALSPIPSSWLV